jgi:hypothetical protein
LTIVNYLPDNGTYEWKVPHHISSNCLLRVSKAEGNRPLQHTLLYELKFRIYDFKSSSTSGEIFSICLGDAKNQNTGDFIPEISFIRETNGKVYIQFEEAAKEIKLVSKQWHMLKVLVNVNPESGLLS